MMPEMIPSPCTGVCKLDPSAAHCTGCRRTLAEIAAWGSMSELERQTVLDDLPRRQAGG